jgi:hypothetical protein
MKKHFIFKIILFSALGAAFVVALSFAVMHLWNWLIPSLFGGPTVDIWKAGGLLVLSKILFSGFGKGCRSCKSRKAHYWKDKLANMSPEEREKLKSKWRCWGASCDDES